MDKKVSTTQDSIQRAYFIGTTNKVSGEILGNTYYAFCREDNYYGCVTNEKNDTVFKDSNIEAKPRFIDFNKDGVTDIMFKSNVGDEYDFIVFDIESKSFKKIKDFDKYPAPIKMGNSNYYYSYYHEGCADHCWGSDLFYIKDYRAVRIGNISKSIDEDGKEFLMSCTIRNEMKLIFKQYDQKTMNECEKNKWKFLADF